MAINRASTIDLAQSSLHLGKFEAHFFGLLVGQGGNGALVDRSGRCETEVGGRFCDVEFEHLEAVLVGHCPSCTLVDPHCVPCETTLFFQVAVHQVKRLGKLGRTILQGLLKQVAESLNADLPVHSLGQVQVPEFKCNWIHEKIQASLIYLERLFEVFVFF